MSEVYKKKYKHWNNVELLIISVSAVTGCVPISEFTSLVCVPIGITSSAVGIKICEITAEIKRISQLWRKKKKHNEIVLLGKAILNTAEVLISK